MPFELLDHTRLPQSHCLNCGRLLDAASPVTDDGIVHKPQPGDASVCISCGHLMTFGDDLRLRNPTDEELVRAGGMPALVIAQKAREMTLAERPDFQVPQRLRHRPRDRRGYVIPWVQFVRPDGEPDFRVIDNDKTVKGLRQRLCGLCGEQMGRHIFFIGGPLCVDNGYFYDPPMHRECAIYALQACPHLARAKGKYSAPVVKDVPAGTKIAVGEMKLEKPDWFGLMHAREYTFGRMESGMMLVRARLPWVEVLRYRDGALIQEPG